MDWRMLGRLPMRFWIQLVLGLVVLGVLAVFGFALLLGGAVIVLGIGLMAQLLSWFRGRGPQAPASTTVIDGEYQVVDQKNPQSPGAPRSPDM